MTVCSVPVEHLSFIWPLARPHIARALLRDKAQRFLPSDVLDLLLKGSVRLWVAWNEDKQAVDAAMITEIIEFPRLRELKIWLVGGTNLAAWGREARDLFELFGREHGCAVMSGALRRGWLRIGGPGYEETGIMFEKRL